MIKKSDKIMCACISLMLERYNGQFELKDVLFTRSELYDRALSIFPDGKKLTYLEFRKYVVNFGANTDEDCLIQDENTSFIEYYRLFRPQNYDAARTVDNLMASHWNNHTRFRSKAQIKEFLDDYFAQDFSVPVQIQNTEIITREAIWIAAATLTFNEYHRTLSREKENYEFSQVTIAKVANSFNPENGLDTCRQMTRVQCTEGKSKQPYSYLVDEGGEGRDSRRRISYYGEYEYTQPEIHKDFQIATILGMIKVDEIERFIHYEFSPIFFKCLIPPLDDTHSFEEMELQAENMDFESLRAAAIQREEKQPNLFRVVSESYRRDPYIKYYARARANGYCQLCRKEAPFENSKGQPYLETHHIIWLSEGGADSIDNVVALCPNCHRKMHIVKDEKDILYLQQLVLSGK